MASRLSLGCLSTKLAVVAAGVMGAVVGTSTVAAATTGDDVLVGDRAQHPVTALIGIPSAATRAPAGPITSSGWQVSLLHGNAFMGGATDGEQLLLDGETTELALTGRAALGSCLAASWQLPFIAHSAGSFDAAIETWHDWFGLPNAGRANVARDNLAFLHVVGEQTHQLDAASSGLGDVSVWLRGTLGCQSLQPDASLWRVGIKLPSGDEDAWLGSGGTDVWMDLQSRVYQPSKGVHLAASIGAIFPGSSDVFPTLERAAAFGSAGMRLSLSPRVVATASFDWHTALFDSNLVELGSFAAQVSAGIRFGATPRTRVDVQITEDVVVDTATDIALRIVVTTLPDLR